MKGFLLFFIIVLVVHTLVNYYIFIRGWQAIPRDSAIRPVYAIVFFILYASYIVGEFLERQGTSFLSDTLVWIGAFWMAFMVYFLLICIVIDLFRAINHFLNFAPAVFLHDYARTKWYAFLGITSGVSLLIFAGYLHAASPRVKEMALHVAKPAGDRKSLRVVAFADTHFGTIIRNTRAQLFVEKINALKPDLIMISGDIVDGNPDPVIEQKIGDILKGLQTTYGTFGVNGNHEFFGDLEKTDAYLNAHGVRMLRDTVVEIGPLYLVGREDRTIEREGKKRKTIEEMVRTLDKSRPIFMMDHQPFHLEEGEQAGIDFQFYGHTHYAQIWPLGYITDMVYEVAWGYKKKTNTHVYVTCGIGTWGPPVRIGSTPEILCFTFHFE